MTDIREKLRRVMEKVAFAEFSVSTGGVHMLRVEADTLRELAALVEEQDKGIERLREALEWYANEIMPYSITQQSEPRSAVHADRGKRARAALKPPK